MTNRLLPLALCIVLGLNARLAHPQAEPASPASQIQAEIKERGKAMENLAYLSDQIGPRLTGSVNLARAQQWAAAKMREYGAVNVHLEAYDFPSRWVRGTDDFAQLLTQGGQKLEVHAMAWNPPTKGLVTADVALLRGPSNELLKTVDRFKGKIVVLGPVAPPTDRSDAAATEKRLFKALGSRVVALLTSMEHRDGKFTMYGSPYDFYFEEYFSGWPRVPFGFLTSENRSLLNRLLRRGVPVRMKLRLGGAITRVGVKEHNVVGEIRGSEKPNEIVIVGGHLDSWDLGTGTTDNGTGSVATLELLRVYQKLGLRPKRTLRFILFSGEEQGVCGSKAYAAAHKAEMESIQAVVIDDLGAGKPTGFTLQGHKEWLPFLQKAMEPLAGLGVKNVAVETHWDSDQDPFVEKGVPGFFMDQDITDYFASTHHSQTDMFDHVVEADYLMSIQAFAVVAWELANSVDRIPHVTPGHLIGTGK